MPEYAVTVIAARIAYISHGPERIQGKGDGVIATVPEQIYTITTCLYLHQGITRAWSLAVEVAFYGGLRCWPTCCGSAGRREVAAAAADRMAGRVPWGGGGWR